MQEPAAALQLLEEAAMRLQEAAGFDRGDVAPHNALGDVLLHRSVPTMAPHAAFRQPLQEPRCSADNVPLACSSCYMSASFG